MAPTSNDINGGPVILGIFMTTLGIAVACVTLRCYIRLRITKSFGWDDACIVLAGALAVAAAAFTILDVHWGAGRHSFDLEDPAMQIPKVVMWHTIYQIDQVLSVNFTKMSILIFILRIQNSKIMAATIWPTMIIMIIVNLLTVSVLVSQCRPLPKLWHPSIAGTCFARNELSKFGYAQGVVNVLTDFFCAVMPGIIVFQVKIKLRTKIVITLLTSLGLMATASSIVRVVLLNTLQASDYSHSILGITLAAILDQNLGIVAACIPTFRPVFRSFGNGSSGAKSTGTAPFATATGRSYNGLHETHRASGVGKKDNFVRLNDSGEQKFLGSDEELGLPLQELTPPPQKGITLKRTFDVEHGESLVKGPAYEAQCV